MTKEQIFEQHAKVRTNANSIGTCEELFSEFELTPTVKNLTKRVNLDFFDKATGKSLNVVASKSVNALYRNGQISIRQMLTMPVYMTSTNEKGEPLTDKLTGEPITVFSVGQDRGASVGMVKDIETQKYVPEAVDLDSVG